MCDTADNSGVHVYYLKGLVSVYFRCPARTVGFSGTCLLLMHLQPTKLRDAQSLPTYWLNGSTRGLQPGGHMHKEAVHLLSLKLAYITSSGAFNLSVIAYHSLERTQADPLCLSEETPTT